MKKILIGSTLSVAAAWAYLRHIQLPPGPNCLGWGQQVFGHRGCMHIPGVPENTLEAFSFAQKNGASGIELDVRMAKDGPVCFHDARLSPLLESVDPELKVSSMTVEELKNHSFANDPSKSIKVPTLEEAILFCRDNYLFMLIEVKDLANWRSVVDHVLAMYDRYPDFMLKYTAVISFHPASLYAIRKKNPKIAVGVLHSDTLLRTWKSGGAEPFPFFLRFGTRFFDLLQNQISSRIVPWVVGASIIAPKCSLFTNRMKEKWTNRRVAINLWGFTETDQFTWDMAGKGTFLTVDDKYAVYGQRFKDRADQEKVYFQAAATRERLELEQRHHHKN